MQQGIGERDAKVTVLTHLEKTERGGLGDRGTDSSHARLWGTGAGGAGSTGSALICLGATPPQG